MTITKLSISKQLSILKSDLSRKSPRTQTCYLSIAKKFLTESGDFSRHGIITWLNTMDWCDNSRRASYYAIKRLCKALDKKFPLDKEDLPPLPDEEEIWTPTMSLDNIKRLISYWKKHPGDYLTSLVFLSTVYGPRAGEMVDIDISRNSIVITVLKRKRKVTREHPVPEDMMKYLVGYIPMSERTVEYAFGKVCRRAGVVRRKKEGWHSIRRAFNTRCRDLEIPSVLYKRFLRWTRDRRDMGDIYYHKEFSIINQEMLKVHPFLGFW